MISEIASTSNRGVAAPRLKAGFGHIPTLDGWRALAVVSVVYYHAMHNGLKPGSIWFRLASRAHLGVDVFFAISGFLICGRLLQELTQTGTISLSRFYLRRCFRIFPAVWFYLAVLAFLSALGWINTTHWEFASTLLFVRNYFPVFEGQVVGVFTAQFWSLAVEEHFYLLWPGILLLLGPKNKRIASVAFLMAIAILIWRLADEAHGWLIPAGTSTQNKTDTRLDALLWGCLAAVVYPMLVERLKDQRWRSLLWIPVTALAAVVVLAKPFALRSLFQAILFPMLLLSTCLAPESPLSQALEWPWMKWIGRLSYSIYIWQELAMFSAKPLHSPLHRLEHFPNYFLTIVVLAIASYYLVERPMIRLGHRLTAEGRTPLSTRSPALQDLRVAS